MARIEGLPSTRPVPAPAGTAVWCPCPTCLGQRQLFELMPDGTVRPEPCPGCLGVGEVIVSLVHPPRPPLPEGA